MLLLYLKYKFVRFVKYLTESSVIILLQCKFNTVKFVNFLTELSVIILFFLKFKDFIILGIVLYHNLLLRCVVS